MAHNANDRACALHARKNYAVGCTLRRSEQTNACVRSGLRGYCGRARKIIKNQGLENRIQVAEGKAGVKEGDAGVLREVLLTSTALAAVVYCDEANNGSRGAQLPLKQLTLFLLSCFLFLCFFLCCHGSSPYEWFNYLQVHTTFFCTPKSSCTMQLVIRILFPKHDYDGWCANSKLPTKKIATIL